MILRPESMVVPYGAFQRRELVVPYAEILGIEELRIWGSIFLELTLGSRKVTITENLLPDRASYEAIRDFLIARAEQSIAERASRSNIG